MIFLWDNREEIISQILQLPGWYFKNFRSACFFNDHEKTGCYRNGLTQKTLLIEEKIHEEYHTNKNKLMNEVFITEV